MARVSEEEVRCIVDDDPNISMAGFINLATTIVDRVDTCDTDNVLTDPELKNIETLVAAHFYTLRDPLYDEKRTEKAMGIWGDRRTVYLDAAFLSDPTSCLKNVGKVKPELTWMGKPPSEQIDYKDRD